MKMHGLKIKYKYFVLKFEYSWIKVSGRVWVYLTQTQSMANWPYQIHLCISILLRTKPWYFFFLGSNAWGHKISRPSLSYIYKWSPNYYSLLFHKSKWLLGLQIGTKMDLDGFCWTIFKKSKQDNTNNFYNKKRSQFATHKQLLEPQAICWSNSVYRQYNNSDYEFASKVKNEWLFLGIFFFIKEKMGKRATWAGVFNVGVTIVAPYSPGLGLQEQRIQMSHNYAPNLIEDTSEHELRVCREIIILQTEWWMIKL